MNQTTQNVVFALKITGMTPQQICPLELAKLLSSLTNMLGKEHLYFDQFRTGSAYIQLMTDQTHASEKLEKLNHAVQTKDKNYQTILKFTRANPHTTTQLQMGHANDSNWQVIHTFDVQEQGFSFAQTETLRGKLVGLKDNHQKNDTATLRLTNGETVSLHCDDKISAELAILMAQFWKSDQLIEFHGEAKYQYNSFNDVKLLGFKVQSFELLKEMSMSTWLKTFIGAGDSGWQTLDDPIKTWQQERG